MNQSFHLFAELRDQREDQAVQDNYAAEVTEVQYQNTRRVVEGLPPLSLPDRPLSRAELAEEQWAEQEAARMLAELEAASAPPVQPQVKPSAPLLLGGIVPQLFKPGAVMDMSAPAAKRTGPAVAL